MAEILASYLAEVAKTRFSYDGADCGAFAFGWADVVTGRNGMESWRGQYRTEAECSAAIGRHGGMRSWALQFLANQYGFEPTRNKFAGNIILAEFGSLKTMAIRVSDRMIALRSNGVHMTHRAKVLEEWGVMCRQS